MTQLLHYPVISALVGLCLGLAAVTRRSARALARRLASGPTRSPPRVAVEEQPGPVLADVRSGPAEQPLERTNALAAPPQFGGMTAEVAPVWCVKGVVLVGSRTPELPPFAERPAPVRAARRPSPWSWGTVDSSSAPLIELPRPGQGSATAAEGTCLGFLPAS